MSSSHIFPLQREWYAGIVVKHYEIEYIQFIIYQTMEELLLISKNIFGLHMCSVGPDSLPSHGL